MDSDQRPLAVSDLTVRHGDVVALNDVSVSVRPGERVALIGPSGAGKSSLINVAAGIVEPTSGVVSVLGHSLAELSGSSLQKHRRQVGIVSQALGLAPSLRVVHSVNGGRLGSWSTPAAIASLVRPRERDRVSEVLTGVGLADRIDARTGDLSGGEQQRVAIARALLQRPQLLLADEPTSSVDPELSNQMMGLLCDRDAPWTAVISVHDPDLALRHVDRIIAMNDGSIVFDRPVGEVDPASLDELYERS